MRDNGITNSTVRMVRADAGDRQLKPIEWVRTEYQIGRQEGFAPEAIAPRDPPPPSGSNKPTMRLATPPAWTHRDDLPCVKWVPKGNQPDPYDTSDRLVARALCAGCPVKAQCLADAMEEEAGLSAGSRYLVRGGLTPRGRWQREQRLSNSPDGLSD